WPGGGLPGISLSVSRTGQMAGELAKLHVDIPLVLPGLLVDGDLNLRTREVSLESELRGQDAGIMLKVLGVHLAAPVSGNVYGMLKATGPLTDPVFTFNGLITHGRVRDFEFD